MPDPHYNLKEKPDYDREIPALTISTPAHAETVMRPLLESMLNNTEYVRQRAEEIAEDMAGRLDAAVAETIALSNRVADNTSRVSTLWDALFSDITTNPFTIGFADLTGITLTSGVWNRDYQRLEC